MALFQPTNITPDMKGGTANGVVYVPANPSTDTIAVSWTVNGNSPLVAYKIDFYKNDANSTYVATTGKVTLGTPFSAIAADGTETQFTANVLYSLFGTTAALETPKEGKIQITQWWGSTDDESIVQKSMSVFRLTRHSSVAVSGPTETDGNYVFTGTFTPPGSGYGDVVLNWTRWYAEYDNVLMDYPIVRDTGRVWGATAYSWSISGLYPGSYSVYFTGETSDGEYVFDVATFVALEDAVVVPNAPISLLCDKGRQAVGVQAGARELIQTSFHGSYTESGGKLQINSGGSAKWTIPALTDAPWSFIWSGKLSNQSDPLFEVVQSNGTVVSFGYEVGGNLFYSDPYFSELGNIQPDISDEYIIAFSMGTTAGTKNNFYWYVTQLHNGAVVYGASGVVSGYAQSRVTSIILYEGTTTYWKLCYGTENSGISQAWISGTDPVFYGLDVRFPKDGIDPDVIDYAQINYFGGMATDATAYLYRVENEIALRYVGTPFIIAEQDVETPVVYDYTALNNSSYQYAIIVRYPSENGENVIFLQSEATTVPCFWSWALIEADETEAKGVYQASAVYLFSANVSTSEMANGNARNLYSTFTRYPVVMRNAQNRKSGTLSGLIGSINNGEYYDTNATMNAIYALSTSQKPLFLRSRRGDFMRISLAGEIKMSVADSTVKQQATASVPWVEIADASTMSVIDSPIQNTPI